MKQLEKLVCAIFLIALFTQLGIISTAHSTITASQEKSETLIKNVLPIDSSQYNMTLRNYSVPKLPDIGYYKQSYVEQEILTYSLESKDSTLDVICTFSNNV